MQYNVIREWLKIKEIILLLWGGVYDVRLICFVICLSVGFCVFIGFINGEKMRVNLDNNYRRNYSKLMENIFFFLYEMRNVLKKEVKINEFG